jgi:small subunit ribosomal protein S16
MLTIRFERVGKRNKAQFKIALQEKTVAPGGRHIEILGSYDPHTKQAILKEDRIKYWLSKGAQASDTAWNLFVSKNVITDKKRAVKMPARNASQSEAGGPAKKVEEAAEVKEAPKAAEEKKAEGVKAEEVKEDKKPEESKAEEKPVEEAKVEKAKEEKKPEEVKAESRLIGDLPERQEKPAGASIEASKEEVKTEEKPAEEAKSK